MKGRFRQNWTETKHVSAQKRKIKTKKKLYISIHIL